MKINSLKNIKSLKGKKVLLRVDFNVPILNGKIKDDHRILAGLETIEFLLKKKASLVIISHLGAAKGEFDKQYSLSPIAFHLEKLLRKKVNFLSNHDPEAALNVVSNIKEGEIIFLENLRFNKGELSDNAAFAKKLASLGDIYVNDAFSVSHRPQASISSIKKYLPAYAGLLLEKEVTALYKIIAPKKPLVVIMGGAKISTKAPLIFSLYGKADKILIGGALATTFFKLFGFEVGKSFYDEKISPKVSKMLKEEKYFKKLVLPIDLVVKGRNDKVRVCFPDEVKKSEMILDIGPETISLFAENIKKAATLVWNGPMGKFEEDSFKQGSLSVARLVAARSKGSSFGVVGGGETIEVLKMTKMEEYIDFISTAGGAMLSYLGGENMPGLEKIISLKK